MVAITKAPSWMDYWFGWRGKEWPNLIHFVHGEKGGVGKSFFARALFQYFLDRQVEVWGVEADRNMDLMDYYKEALVKWVIITEDHRLATMTDRLIELALERSLVVDLPSQVTRPLDEWMEKSEVIEVCKEQNVGIVVWYVSSGGYTSVSLFTESLAKWGTQLPHILVKNLHFRNDWSAIEEKPGWAEMMKASNVRSVDLPFLDYTDRDKIEEKRLTFTEALSGTHLVAVEKTRVRRFLKRMYGQFDELGLLPPKSTEDELGLLPPAPSKSEQLQ